MSDSLHEEEALGKVYDSELIGRLWPFVRPSAGLVFLSLILIPLRGALEVLPPLIVGGALNFLVHGAVTSDIAWIEGFLQPTECAINAFTTTYFYFTSFLCHI